ncbi:MAG TPA: zf-TFIIB domain-containing protein [Kofleriaceae bacterium]|nr:zf-TFIIB domain-containing protein [Kofleriaceae bacterium]
MTCPRCRGPIEDMLEPRVVAGRCAACGGVWVDARSQRGIRAGGAALTGGATVDGAPHPVVDTSPPVACPVCGAWMRREHVADAKVDIDLCDAHGAWFDASELRAIARARNVAWDTGTDWGDGILRTIGSLVDLLRSPFGG